MENGGIEWQMSKVAMAAAKGKEREEADERFTERN